MMLNETRYGHAADGAHERMTRAWTWLCEQRTQAPDHADVWDIRWQNLNSGEGWLTDLTTRILRGEYRLSPLQLHGRNEQRKVVWGAQDALVMKWVALSLQDLLPLHECCEYIQGHGGGKPSTDKLHGLLTDNAEVHEKKTDATTTPDAAETRHYKWVCRTDIRGDYRNINKQTLMQQVSQHVQDPVLRDLVAQYVHYTVEDGGTFHTPEKGISRGCPLSPLMGALHLYDMDAHFSQQKHIHYARYMDDVIILAKTRWQLRKHTKRLMQWFSEYGFEAHPDKTHIGRTEKGFDWMGAWLTHEGVTDIAPRAKANHREKVRRLYEQLARLPAWKRKSAAPKVHVRVSAYRRRWNIWAASVLCMAAVTSAHGAGTLIVLTPITGARDLGATFTSTGSTYGNVYFGSGNNVDWGGLCLSGSQTSCDSKGTWTARETPLGWGVADTVQPNLVLVPRGYIEVTCKVGTTCDPLMVQRFDPASGAAVTHGGQSYQACSPIEGDSGARSTFYTLGSTSKCPYDMTGYVRPVGGVDTYYGTLNYSLQLSAFARGPISAGSWSPLPLYVGLHTYRDNIDIVVTPNKIVVVGLICSLSSQTGGVYSLGVVTGGSNGRVASGLLASQLGLTASCTGSNSTGQAVPIGYKIQPSAGGNMRIGGKGLEVSGQPSFYMNFTNNGVPSCDESQATSIPVDGVTSTHIADVAPGAALQTTPVNLGAALCSTDDTTQHPGPYSMSIIASIVSY